MLVIITPILLWGCALWLGWVAWRRPGGEFRRGLRISAGHLGTMAPRILVALPMAAFLAELIPGDLVGEWLGTTSGWQGILLASGFGMLVPAGGMIAFPLALALLKVGVGLPQLIAFLTAWSVFAIHRVIAFEIPFLGIQFAALRLASSVILAPLSGLIATYVVPLTAVGWPV